MSKFVISIFNLLMKKITFYTLLCCLMAFAQTAFAQATLSIQGIIQKSSGAAVEDGTYDLTFKLYPTNSGGTAVHTETQSVSVAGGIYSAELGGGGTPLTAPFDQTYYLGVSVDGSAELIPRTRLTSSPYALSLLGTENLFSSAGTVGIGTVTPASGYQLHTKKPSGTGKILLEGSDAAQLDFKKGGTVGSLGFGTANNDFVLNPGANNTALQYNGTNKLTVTTNGATLAGTLDATTVNAGTLTANNFSPANMAITSKLAVGQSSVDANYAFRVNGESQFTNYVNITGAGKNFNLSGWVRNSGSGATAYLAGVGNYEFLLQVDGRIRAGEFWVVSDRRIKKDFCISNKTRDLATLQNLKVTDYRHVDFITKGNDLKKGFVAQEVREIFPEAVTISSQFVPNVYEVSDETKFSVGKMTVSLNKKHEFAVGDEVKIMMPDNSERTLIVKAAPSETSFSVNWEEAVPEKVFVYGKKVSDFHVVDYDRIFTLNVSATQELARKVELLEKENAVLKSENGMLKSEMKASAEKFDARLQALESRISN
jgi:hypothetical protein